jgi:hypothetical protein
MQQAGAIAALSSGHLVEDIVALENVEQCEACHQFCVQHIQPCTNTAPWWLHIFHTLIFCPESAHGGEEFFGAWRTLAKAAPDRGYIAHIRLL